MGRRVAGGAEAAGRGGEAWTLRNEPGSGTRRGPGQGCG